MCCLTVLCSSEVVLCALKVEWNAVDYAITVGCEVVFCVQSRGGVMLVRCAFNRKVGVVWRAMCVPSWCSVRDLCRHGGVVCF